MCSEEHGHTFTAALKPDHSNLTPEPSDRCDCGEFTYRQVLARNRERLTVRYPREHERAGVAALGLDPDGLVAFEE